MPATIKVFQVGEERFSHVLQKWNNSVELRDENDNVLLTYAGTRVNNEEGRMGSFEIESIDGNPLWVYYEKAQQIRLVLSPDLSSAEVAVSRRYIGASRLIM